MCLWLKFYRSLSYFLEFISLFHCKVSTDCKSMIKLFSLYGSFVKLFAYSLKVIFWSLIIQFYSHLFGLLIFKLWNDVDGVNLVLDLAVWVLLLSCGLSLLDFDLDTHLHDFHQIRLLPPQNLSFSCCFLLLHFSLFNVRFQLLSPLPFLIFQI